ncbi:hypothetical protein BH09SUM1_BH09SUM1_21870 [soil metagenome]
MLVIGSCAVASAAQTGGFYYTATRTEPIAAVAARQGIPAAMLATANRVSASSTVKKGSKLWIPKVAVTSSPKPSFKQATALKTPKPKTSSSPVSIPKPLSKPVAKAPAPKTEDDSDDVPGGGVRTAAPRAETVPEPDAAAPSTVRPSARGYIWPLEGKLLRRFTSRADEKFTGIDISAARGTEVRAASDGKVVYAGDSIPSYGRMVIISHPGNVASCYAQLDRLAVSEKQSVQRGQVIGRSGDSGRGGMPFLHFEIRRNGDAVDPEPYLP